MNLVHVAALTAVAIGASAVDVSAQTASFPPITNRSFNIDLFEQPAIGSPRLIAMSGAVNSVAEGAAGLFTNAASAAVRSVQERRALRRILELIRSAARIASTRGSSLMPGRRKAT